MTIELGQETRGIVSLRSEEGPLLGVHISSKIRNFSLTQIKSRNCFLGRDGRTETIPFIGIREVGGSVYSVLPYREGITLAEAAELEPEKALPLFLRAVKAIETVSRSGNLPKKFFLNGILILKGEGAEDPGVLFFPEDVMEKTLNILSPEEKADYVYHVNHPDRRGRAAGKFSVAAVLYKLFSGKYPFDVGSADVSLIHEKMREGNVIPSGLASPRIRDEIASQIDGAFAAANAGEDALESLEAALTICVDHGCYRPVTEEELRQKEKKNTELRAGIDKRFNTRRFLTRYKFHLAGGALGFALLVWFVASVLSGLFAPPITMGKTQPEVARMFYDAINTQDHQVIEECADKKVAKMEVNEAIYRYVISRMRLAVEGASGVVNAGEWVDMGRPPLADGETLFGITDLELDRVSLDAIRAKYEKWQPWADEESDTPKTEVLSCEDTLSFTIRKKAWIISAIERGPRTRIDFFPK